VTNQRSTGASPVVASRLGAGKTGSHASNLVLCAAIAATVFLAAGAARADSLWAKAPHRTRSLIADDTARDVGDTLTIIINEQSSVENETERELERKSTRDASMSGNADLKDLVSAVRGATAFRFPSITYAQDASTKFGGTADFEADRKVTDQITVLVEDVLPNGNLVVLGTRHRDVAGEVQTVQVSGVVRPSDINYSNTVLSARVADFRLVVKVEGEDNRVTRPGWWDRLWNVISPF